MDLAGGSLRHRTEKHHFGHLEAGQMLTAIIDHFVFRKLDPLAQFDKGTGHLAPLGIGPRHHCGGDHRRMLVEHVLDFQRGNVLSPGNDNVLGAILDLDITVGLHHGQIAGMEPAAGEGFRAGLGILQIALHGQIAAEEDFPHGLAIPGHRLHADRIKHGDRLLHVIGHALAPVDHRLFLHRRNRHHYIQLMKNANRYWEL